MTAPRCIRAPVGEAAARAAALRAGIPAIETPRLRLRAPELSDLPAWTRIMVPDADGDLGGPHDDEAAWEAFCVYVAGWLLHGHGIWTVERLTDGETLGFVHLGLEWGDHEPELGWMLLPEHRGRGYATEAAQAARDHGLALLGDGAFVSYVHDRNDPSHRVARRLGAVRDAAAEAAIGDGTHVWRHRVEGVTA